MPHSPIIPIEILCEYNFAAMTPEGRKAAWAKIYARCGYAAAIEDEVDDRLVGTKPSREWGE